MNFNSEKFDYFKSAGFPSERVTEEEFADFAGLNLKNSENLFSITKKEEKTKTNKSASPAPKIPGKRLNGYDSKLLEDACYQKLENEDLKLENKIERVEKTLKEADEKISIASSFNNKSLLVDLNRERAEYVRYLNKLKKEYEGKNAQNKFTEQVAQAFSKIEETKNVCKNFYNDKILQPLLSNPILPVSQKSKLRNILTKLNALNKNIDEIAALRIPYGEQEARYNIMAQYLTQASLIHSLIKKEIDI